MIKFTGEMPTPGRDDGGDIGWFVTFPYGDIIGVYIGNTYHLVI